MKLAAGCDNRSQMNATVHLLPAPAQSGSFAPLCTILINLDLAERQWGLAALCSEFQGPVWWN